MRRMYLLDERVISAIKNFRVPDIGPEDYTDEDEIEELWNLQYEIEYKYSMLSDRGFSGVERRRENILRILEKKGEEVNEALRRTLLVVFQEWLRLHAITEPKAWAEARLSEMEEMGSSPGETLESIESEWQSYYSGSQTMWEAVADDIENFPEIKSFFLEAVLEDKKAMMIDDIENGQGDMYFDMDDPDDPGEQQDMLSRVEDMDSDEFEDMISWEDELALLPDMQISYMYLEDILVELMEKLVFPEWYDHWSAEGIDQTRDRVEGVYKELSRMPSYRIRKQFATLSIAKNTNHQTGSMMDYYEERWRVDYRFFKDLTEDAPIDEWNEELEEIGVML